MFPATLPGPVLTIPDAIPEIALAMAPDVGGIVLALGLAVVALGVAAVARSSRIRRRRLAPTGATA